MKDGEGSEEGTVGQGNQAQDALGDFIGDGSFGDDGDAGADFHGAFDGLDVVELHDGADGDLLILEIVVEGLARGDVGFEGDEALVLELGGLKRGGTGQGMAGVTDDGENLVAQEDAFEAGIRFGIRDQSEIDHVAEDIVVDLVGALVLDMDVDGGMGAQELLEVGRQVVEADGIDGGHADGTGDDVFHLLKPGEEGVMGLDDLPTVFVEKLSFAGEPEFLFGTFDEEATELAFE